LSKLREVKECISVPTIQPYIIEPIWEQFRALLHERKVDHPLGCHWPRIPDCAVFEKLVEVLVFGCAYLRIADGLCSATTLRRRRDGWLEAGLMDTLEDMALEATTGPSVSIWPTWPSIAASPKLRAAARKRAKARWTGESGAPNAR
jgi:transposase